MKKYISVRLFATLSSCTPASSENYPVQPGMTVGDLIQELHVPEADVKLIFIDGVKGDLTSVLKGGERIGIFPPVGGG